MSGLNGQDAICGSIKYDSGCQLTVYSDCATSGCDNTVPSKTCSVAALVLARLVLVKSQKSKITLTVLVCTSSRNCDV